jgi:hypothetical protein
MTSRSGAPRACSKRSPISPGPAATVCALEERASRALANHPDQAREALSHSPVVCLDETSWPGVRGQRDWLWTATCRV